MSLVDPLSCGFAKVIAFQIITEPINVTKLSNENTNEFKSRKFNLQYEKYVEQFDGLEKFNVTYKQFTNNFPKVVTLLRHFRNKTQLETKELIMRTFSVENKRSLIV